MQDTHCKFSVLNFPACIVCEQVNSIQNKSNIFTIGHINKPDICYGNFEQISINQR